MQTDRKYPAHTIHEFLGKYVYIKFSVHSIKGVIVEVGKDWLLTDSGSLLWTPCISEITTTIPKPVARKGNLPLDLGDLFL